MIDGGRGEEKDGRRVRKKRKDGKERKKGRSQFLSNSGRQKCAQKSTYRQRRRERCHAASEAPSGIWNNTRVRTYVRDDEVVSRGNGEVKRGTHIAHVPRENGLWFQSIQIDPT